MFFKKKILLFVVFLALMLQFFCFLTYAEENTGLASVNEILSDGENKIKVTYSAVASNSELILALYQGNVLLETKNCTVTPESTSHTFDFGNSDITGATLAKAFIWDSLENMKAVSNAKSENFPLDDGKIKLNYKRNSDGTQAFLYKFGTTGNKVEISIPCDSECKIDDLEFRAEEVNGSTNKPSVANIFTYTKKDDYSISVKFTEKFAGIVNFNAYLKNTDELQDTMQIEILPGYSNVSKSSSLAQNMQNTCLVPTLENGGEFNKCFTVMANYRFYGNDCTVDVSSSTDNISDRIILVENGAMLENIKIRGPYVDNIYTDGYISDYERYLITPTVSLKEGAELKNAYVKHGASCVGVLGDNVVINNVTVECSPVPIKILGDNMLTFEGENLIVNSKKGNDCTTHKHGLGIAMLDSQKNSVINIDGDLEVCNFVTDSELSHLSVSLPQTSENSKFYFENKNCFNPIGYSSGSVNLIFNISENSNLYELCSWENGTNSKMYCYDKNAVTTANINLSYLTETPEPYKTAIGFETYRYLTENLNSNYNVSVSTPKTIFKNLKFTKYGNSLSYDVTTYKVGIEDETTTVYTPIYNCYNLQTNLFTVPSGVSSGDEIFAVFEVNDIYDNKIYADKSTTLNVKD